MRRKEKAKDNMYRTQDKKTFFLQDEQHGKVRQRKDYFKSSERKNLMC